MDKELSLKIIIVEDDAVISQLIESHLLAKGHTVINIAHNSVKALDYIHNQQPDLVLLDIDLGNSDKDGIEVGEIVHNNYNIPIIYLTAYSDLKTIERAKKTMPCGYIVKPYKPDHLYAAITIGVYNFNNRKKEVKLSFELANSIALQPLSPREFDLLVDIVEGFTNSQIAEKQYISLNTTKWHIQNLYSKMGVKNRTSLAKAIHFLLQ